MQTYTRKRTRLKRGLKSKLGEACTEDRISELPDAVLCHILSFLETRDAVKTSALSHRWNKVWVSVPNVKLSDLVKSGFEGFVDRVLFARGSSNIHYFRFHCVASYDVSRIDGWIRTAIMRNVVELDLYFHFHKYADPPALFELPRRLFTCRSLLVLRLTVLPHFVIKTPTSGCFPSLKALQVDVSYPDADSMENLFSCCPVLEDLSIFGDIEARQVLKFNVSAPKLKQLYLYLQTEIYQCLDPSRHNLSDCGEVYYNIDAPNLEKFTLVDYHLESYSVNTAKSLHTADIIVGDGERNLTDVLPPGDCLHGLFAAIAYVKYLSVKAPIFGDHLLPAFDHLKHLKLNHEGCCSWKSLTHFLKVSPNLEYLDIEMGYDYGDDEYVHEWVPPESVPICLLSCLKSVCIGRDFRGLSAEMEVVKYLLKNGRVLNNMTIDTFDLGFEKDCVLRKLRKIKKRVSKFPRGSKTCQIDMRDRFICEEMKEEMMNLWIRTAIMRNVVGLHLDFMEYPYETNHQCCLSCPEGCFPGLKSLNVSAEYTDAASMEKLFSCCPVLEDLKIDGCLGPDQVLNFNVSAPTLKSLHIDLSIDADPEYNPFGVDHDHRNINYRTEVYVNANTPNLEKFTIIWTMQNHF